MNCTYKNKLMPHRPSRVILSVQRCYIQMCGRTACALDKNTICQRCTLNPSSSNKPLLPRWDDKRSGHKYVPSYNLAPGCFTPVLVLGKFVGAESIVAIQPMYWGLVPSFAPKESSASFATSNARIESLLQKPTYGSSMRQGKRCVVLAQGFYEWKTTDGRKQPYYVYPSDPKKLLMMAGVFAFHEQKQVVLTTDDDVNTWLDPSVLNPQQAQAFLTRIASEAKLAPLSMHPVTQRMNSTRYNEPDCIAPLTEPVDSNIMLRPVNLNDFGRRFWSLLKTIIFAIGSHPSPSHARWSQWLEREFTDRKVRGSNLTCASRLPLSRLGQPDSIPAVVQPSGGMAVGHRKGATAGPAADDINSELYTCLASHWDSLFFNNDHLIVCAECSFDMVTILSSFRKSIKARGSSNLMIKFLKRSEEVQATQPASKKQACDDACIPVEKHEEKKQDQIKTEPH
ncbi:hypothetical protein T265_03021 [Opisthorchis viverrini]|uniref:Abasic site processing protein HMCES n=1 Tax=Opisthorchis viverrini TaxID=6198 RepID=A0A074ZTU1_OPIVI|nr:hypothetical protein T265_03021 [Opisthorchis viverrini]KER30536.1 hypothetical protein T265_03021 [Opisthorchis viverrini]